MSEIGLPRGKIARSRQGRVPSPGVLGANVLPCLLQLLEASGSPLHAVLLPSSRPAMARRVSVHNPLSVFLCHLCYNNDPTQITQGTLFKISWCKSLVSPVTLIPPCHGTQRSWVSVCLPWHHFFNWHLWLKTGAIFSVSHASWLHGGRCLF